MIGQRPDLIHEPDSLLIPLGRNPSRTGDRPKLPQHKKRPQRLIRSRDGREPGTSENVKPTNSRGNLPKRPQHVADLLVNPPLKLLES